MQSTTRTFPDYPTPAFYNPEAKDILPTDVIETLATLDPFQAGVEQAMVLVAPHIAALCAELLGHRLAARVLTQGKAPAFGLAAADCVSDDVLYSTARPEDPSEPLSSTQLAMACMMLPDIAAELLTYRHKMREASA